MNDLTKRFFWLSIYAIAMALLEAVVVVYIRHGMLQVSYDQVSLTRYMSMEIWREVGTLVMLVAVGWLAGRRGVERWAYGLFTFGMWDIWYYIWLKVLIDWPTTLLDWDILFLIPLRWWGPVLSPVLIAALICLAAVLAMVRLIQGKALRITPARVGVGVSGGLLALYVFMSDSLHALLLGRSDWDTLRPEPFKWPLFLMALVLMAVPTLMTTWPGPSRKREIFNSHEPVSKKSVAGSVVRLEGDDI
jgi:hypothetical protein